MCAKFMRKEEVAHNVLGIIKYLLWHTLCVCVCVIYVQYAIPAARVSVCVCVNGVVRESAT